MGAKTSIEWTDATWNPVSGCTKITRGCDNCYAERKAEQYRGSKGFPHGFDITLRPHKLREPLSWRRPLKIFVCSMGDLFHKDVPEAFIAQVFDTMEAADWHTGFQVLTKRSPLLLNFVNDRYRTRPAPRHIWLGVSVEDAAGAARIAHLRKANATIRFLSVEPLLGPVALDLDGIHWVIVGGESGPGARPMHPNWAIDVRDQCLRAQVPFFFKQWGGRFPKSGGCLLEGREWKQFPAPRL